MYPQIPTSPGPIHEGGQQSVSFSTYVHTSLSCDPLYLQPLRVVLAPHQGIDIHQGSQSHQAIGVGVSFHQTTFREAQLTPEQSGAIWQACDEVSSPSPTSHLVGGVVGGDGHGVGVSGTQHYLLDCELTQ